MELKEQLIQQFEQSYYKYSSKVRVMLLELSEEELINKLARDSKMSQMKMIVFWGEEMKKYYVSGKFDGVDIGMEVEASNQYMAVYTFIDEVSSKVRATMSSIFVSEVEEVELWKMKI